MVLSRLTSYTPTTTTTALVVALVVVVVVRWLVAVTRAAPCGWTLALAPWQWREALAFASHPARWQARQMQQHRTRYLLMRMPPFGTSEFYVLGGADDARAFFVARDSTLSFAGALDVLRVLFPAIPLGDAHAHRADWLRRAPGAGRAGFGTLPQLRAYAALMAPIVDATLARWADESARDGGAFDVAREVSLLVTR